MPSTSPEHCKAHHYERLWAGVLARGDAHVNLRFPKRDYREKIWDHAAGQVIVEEAGLIITDAAGELPCLPCLLGPDQWWVQAA